MLRFPVELWQVSFMPTLLVPLDFSHGTNLLLDQATRLAQGPESRIILLHVIEPIPTNIPVGASMDVLIAPIVENTPSQESLQQRVEALAQPLREQGLAVEAHATIGLPVPEILDCAEREQADYILLGSHGRGALYHLFSGSVVTGVLKKTTRPVVVIPVPKKAQAAAAQESAS